MEFFRAALYSACSNVIIGSFCSPAELISETTVHDVMASFICNCTKEQVVKIIFMQNHELEKK